MGELQLSQRILARAMGCVAPYQVAPPPSEPVDGIVRLPLICDRKHDGGGVTNWSRLVRRDAAGDDHGTFPLPLRSPPSSERTD